MSEVVKRLQERREQVWSQAKQIADRAAEESRNFEGEEERQWQSLNAELDAIDKRLQDVIAGEQRAKDISDAYGRLNEQPAAANGQPVDKSEKVQQIRAMLLGEAGAPRGIEIRPEGVFNARSLTKLTAAAGANTVPTSFYDQLVQHMIEVSAILRSGVRILNTSGGETIQVPKTTAHSTAAIVTEGSAIGVSDPTFGQASLGAYKYGVMVQVSRELVDDTGIDLQAYLAEETGRALGNALGAHLVAGTGTNQPRGILTDATVGVTGGTGVAGAFTGDNLIDLFYSVIAPYRNSAQAAWLVKDSTMASLRKIKDTTGQYIFQPSLQAGTPETLLGKPVYTDPFVPATAVTNKSVLFGDWSKYFVRLAGGVRFERSDEFAFSTDLITYRALLRGDGALMDTSGAIKAFAGAAT